MSSDETNHGVCLEDVAEMFVDVNVFGDVGEKFEVVLVLGGAVNVPHFVVADGDGSGRVLEGNAAVRNRQGDRRKLLDFLRR